MKLWQQHFSLQMKKRKIISKLFHKSKVDCSKLYIQNGRKEENEEQGSVGWLKIEEWQNVKQQRLPHCKTNCLSLANLIGSGILKLYESWTNILILTLVQKNKNKN